MEAVAEGGAVDVDTVSDGVEAVTDGVEVGAVDVKTVADDVEAVTDGVGTVAEVGAVDVEAVADCVEVGAVDVEAVAEVGAGAAQSARVNNSIEQKSMWRWMHKAQDFSCFAFETNPLQLHRWNVEPAFFEVSTVTWQNLRVLVALGGPYTEYERSDTLYTAWCGNDNFSKLALILKSQGYADILSGVR